MRGLFRLACLSFVLCFTSAVPGLSKTWYKREVSRWRVCRVEESLEFFEKTFAMTNCDGGLGFSLLYVRVVEVLIFSYVVLAPDVEATWETSACAEPAPVANAYRHVTVGNFGNDVAYSCYDSYVHDGGSGIRQCQATGDYSGDPPTCALDCGDVKPFTGQITVSQESRAGDDALTICDLEYVIESTSSGPRVATCSAELGRWEALTLYCGMFAQPVTACAEAVQNSPEAVKGVLLDLHNPRFSSSASPPAACQTEAEAHPWWQAALSPTGFELYDVDEVTLNVGDAMEDDAVLNVIAEGSVYGWCGNVTTSPTSRNYVVKCQTLQGRKPWGHSIRVSASFADATPGRLELCDVSVQGRIHADNCPSPLNIPRLEVTSPIQSDYVTGDVVEYSCVSGYRALRGSGISECSPFASWINPTLICTDEPNRAEGRHVELYVAQQGSWLSIDSLALVTDGDNSTCYSETSESYISTYKVHLHQEMEVDTVTAIMTGPLVSMEVAILSSAVQGLKTCANVNVTSTFTSVTCDQMLPGDVVQVTVTRLNTTHDFDVCQLAVYGRPYETRLQCKRTETGIEYKGTQNMTQSGRECVTWLDTLALLPTLQQDLPDISVQDAANFCRNPGGHHAGPVCYVRNGQGSLETEKCDVHMCAELCRQRADGQDYTGSINVTSDGRACVRWDLPGVPFRRSEDFSWPSSASGGSKEHSFCRNPGGSQASVWCYVNDRTLEYGFCSVPLCESVPFIRSTLTTADSRPTPLAEATTLAVLLPTTVLLTSLPALTERVTMPDLPDITESAQQAETSMGDSQSSLTDETFILHVKEESVSQSSGHILPTMTTEHTTLTSSSTTLSAVTTSTRKCACACTKEAQLTSQQREESLTSALRHIHSTLSVDKHGLSSTVRSKTSARDDRVSSVAAGMTGVAILVVVGVLLLASDIMAFVAFLHRCLAGRRSKTCR